MHFTIPCETPNLIESKSFKLYLNSFNNNRFADASEVLARLRTDLSEAAWRGSESKAASACSCWTSKFDAQQVHELDGLLLDRLDVECMQYARPGAAAGQSRRSTRDRNPGQQPAQEQLSGHRQPDWGSVQIQYSGPQIDQEGLLQYLVSFRNHNEFHEQCVERIFMDVWARCKPIKLSVYARYTRRGGLDINPFRTSHPGALPANVRTARQ